MQKRVQPGAKLQLKAGAKGRAFHIDPSDRMLQLAADACEDVYGTRALFVQDGGSIAIVETFARELAAPVVMMGFGLPDENLHAPNEHVHPSNFDKGLLTIVSFPKRL